MARQLGEDAITQDDLLSAEKAAEENYLLYVKKQEEARMDDALDERGIVNVAIAEQPVAPALPVWSTWAVLAMGLAAAGAAGTGAAFAADYLDPAFRTPEDVLAYLNSPVLASLPRTARGKAFGMREEVMSAGCFVSQRTERASGSASGGDECTRGGGWNPEDFAREQIRGLVRTGLLFECGEAGAASRIQRAGPGDGCAEHLPAGRRGTGVGDGEQRRRRGRVSQVLPDAEMYQRG